MGHSPPGTPRPRLTSTRTRLTGDFEAFFALLGGVCRAAETWGRPGRAGGLGEGGWGSTAEFAALGVQMHRWYASSAVIRRPPAKAIRDRSRPASAIFISPQHRDNWAVSPR